jgi:hypothetical protein
MKMTKEYDEFMQPPPPMDPADVPLTQIPRDMPKKRQFGATFVLIIIVLGIVGAGGWYWYASNLADEDGEGYVLAGEWMQGNGEVMTIEKNGDFDDGCDTSWSAEGNETTFFNDCSALTDDELWYRTIYSYELIGDVAILKPLSTENQDGMDSYTTGHHDDDVPCLAWVRTSIAGDAEAWTSALNSTAIPEMCHSVRDFNNE